MKRGIYIAQTIAYACLNKISRRGATVWAGGPGKIRPCLKCERCGKSVTIGEE